MVIKKNNFSKLYLLFLFCGGMFLIFGLNITPTPVTAQITKSSDAIAVRVVPNPSHLSALDWYNSNSFQGSPQALVIDGYSAIRDGRTVYVNAANLVVNTLYTNIYIISYTQEAEMATMDIFSRILGNWTFNNNLSTLLGHCRGETTISCIEDSECPIRDHCDSKKARVVRDTRRLEDFAVVQKAINLYKETNGYFPKLKSGSYLAHKSISTWPSWEDALSDELGIEMPKDPINKLGPCGDDRFTTETCWDEVAKNFYNSDSSDLNLPNNSLVYVYSGKSDGIGYDFCGIMESGSVLSIDSCSEAGMCLVGSGAVEMVLEAENHAPEFIGYNFPLTYSGEPYNAYLQAVDPDGDNLTWSMTGTWTTWIEDPSLQDIGIRGQRRIYSSGTGNVGRYDFTVTIDDGRGETNSVVTRDYYIVIEP